MKNALTAVPFTLILLILSVPGHSQSVQDPLRLVQTISIPGVEGRFDHLAVDLKGKRLFLAAQKHRSVEVFDLAAGKRIHSIGGIGEPHAGNIRGMRGARDREAEESESDCHQPRHRVWNGARPGRSGVLRRRCFPSFGGCASAMGA